MFEDFNEIEKKFNSLLEKRKLIEERLKELEKVKSDLNDKLLCLEESKVLVQNLVKNIQEKIGEYISHVVSLALDIVFPKVYQFKVKFLQRKNKIECDFILVRENEEISPLDSGGGVVDIVSFALRTIFWSLSKYRPVLILDEPFRNVSTDLQFNCGEMLKTLSSELGLQILLISHSPDIISQADRVFEVSIKKGVSDVRVVK